MPEQTVKKDFIVVGGGLAGVCAAVAAARNRVSVALVHDRPVLGGNSSSEIRVWATGAAAMGANKYASEAGIIGEMLMTSLFRNPEGNPVLWDMVVLDTVLREPSLSLFLNTAILGVQVQDGRIVSVRGHQQGTEKEFCFEGALFADTTGDGVVGSLAGADCVMGREGRSVYGERFAPDEGDGDLLGNTLLYYTKDTGKPVSYVKPDFAYSHGELMKLLPEGKLGGLNQLSSGCNLWYLEYGGHLNTIESAEDIRDELRRVVFGVWDYVKNSGNFPEAANYTLEWVASIPGKRESRRFIGDYVLKQQDLEQTTRFEDGVCFGGWPIDTHPAGGIFSNAHSCMQSSVAPYEIPLRSLYSRNITNLLFAGRSFSASHIAFASARVMKTCALMGQSIGAAAAYLIHNDLSHMRQVASAPHIERFRQSLLAQDCSVMGLKNTDTGDLARRASITSSSDKTAQSIIPDERAAISQDMFVFLGPARDLAHVELLLDASKDTVLEAELHHAPPVCLLGENTAVSKCRISVKKCAAQWMSVKTASAGYPDGAVILKLYANPAVCLYATKDICPGIFATYGRPTTNRLLYPCIKLLPRQTYYAANNVINGYNRPYRGVNLWLSDGIPAEGAWLELRLETPSQIGRAMLFFDNDLNRDYNNLAPDYMGNGWDGMPLVLVKNYRLEFIDANGCLRETVRVQDNIQRLRIHDVSCEEIERVRLTVESTYGAANAGVYEIRLYAPVP